MNTQEQSYKASTMERFKTIIWLSKLGGTALFMKNLPIIYELYQYTMGSLLWAITILGLVRALTNTDDLLVVFETLSTAMPFLIPSYSDLLIR